MLCKNNISCRNDENSDLIEAEQLITIINQGIHQENDDIAFVENF